LFVVIKTAHLALEAAWQCSARLGCMAQTSLCNLTLIKAAHLTNLIYSRYYLKSNFERATTRNQIVSPPPQIPLPFYRHLEKASETSFTFVLSTASIPQTPWKPPFSAYSEKTIARTTSNFPSAPLKTPTLETTALCSQHTHSPKHAYGTYHTSAAPFRIWSMIRSRPIGKSDSGSGCRRETKPSARPFFTRMALTNQGLGFFPMLSSRYLYCHIISQLAKDYTVIDHSRLLSARLAGIFLETLIGLSSHNI